MVALAFVLLTLYLIFYATVGILGLKFLGSKVAKKDFGNTKLLLVVSIITSIGLATIWIISNSISVLFPLVISLSLALKAYVELRKKTTC